VIAGERKLFLLGETVGIPAAIERYIKMSTPFKYDWGQAVRVRTFAPASMHSGRAGSVCGMRELKGQRIYLIEFSNGEAVEIGEDHLEALESE
jgi:hypothetical protein